LRHRGAARALQGERGGQRMQPPTRWTSAQAA